MKPLPESCVAPSIAKALASVDKAKASLAEAVKKARATCQHRFVSEKPYSSIGPAERICEHCRLIETGSHWSGGSVWSSYDHKPPHLGNVEGRIVRPVTRDVFYALRISING